MDDGGPPLHPRVCLYERHFITIKICELLVFLLESVSLVVLLERRGGCTLSLNLKKHPVCANQEYEIGLGTEEEKEPEEKCIFFFKFAFRV